MAGKRQTDSSMHLSVLHPLNNYTNEQTEGASQMPPLGQNACLLTHKWQGRSKLRDKKKPSEKWEREVTKQC